MQLRREGRGIGRIGKRRECFIHSFIGGKGLWTTRVALYINGTLYKLYEWVVNTMSNETLTYSIVYIPIYLAMSCRLITTFQYQCIQIRLHGKLDWLASVTNTAWYGSRHTWPDVFARVFYRSKMWFEPVDSWSNDGRIDGVCACPDELDQVGWVYPLRWGNMRVLYEALFTNGSGNCWWDQILCGWGSCW